MALAFRGSGEGNLTSGELSNSGTPYTYGDSKLVTNGWEGITLDGLFEALSTTVYEGFKADKIPVLPIGPASADSPYGYDAVIAVSEGTSIDSALTLEGSNLVASASRGAAAATHIMNDHLQNAVGCPLEPKFVAVGYSQGAMAARHTAELNPYSVVGVVNIGDPYQKPNAPGVREAGADGIGIIRWKANDDESVGLDAYYASLGRELTSSICHDGDPICQFEVVPSLVKLATGLYSDHLDYYSDAYPGEADADALEIAKLAQKYWLLAIQAHNEGKSVGGDASALSVNLRVPTMRLAGQGLVLTAETPGAWGADLQYEFDLDGDGIFETAAATATLWTNLSGAQPQRVGVRVTDPKTGQQVTDYQTLTFAAPKSADIRFAPTGEVLPPAADAPQTQTQTQTMTQPAPQPVPYLAPATLIVPPRTVLVVPTLPPANPPIFSAPPVTGSPTPPVRDPNPDPNPNPDPETTPEPNPDPVPNPDPETNPDDDEANHPAVQFNGVEAISGGESVTMIIIEDGMLYITGSGFADGSEVRVTPSNFEVPLQDIGPDGGFALSAEWPWEGEGEGMCHLQGTVTATLGEDEVFAADYCVNRRELT